MLFLEKQNAREVFEAKKEMIEFQRVNNDLAPHRKDLPDTNVDEQMR